MSKETTKRWANLNTLVMSKHMTENFEHINHVRRDDYINHVVGDDTK